MTHIIRVVPPNDLADNLAAAHDLRRRVFIDEQGFSDAEEWDDRDGDAILLLAFDGDTAVGTARLFVDGITGSIGRICVLAEQRGTGLGAALVNEGCRILALQGCQRATLSAQIQAQGFYEKLGFAAHGDSYLDGAVPHVHMDKAL